MNSVPSAGGPSACGVRTGAMLKRLSTRSARCLYLPTSNARQTSLDRERYQTVYARTRGSVAAPTAGLHLSEATFARLAARAIERSAITLHVGYGTFQPIRTEEVEAHRIDPEPYEISESAAAAIAAALETQRRIVAVGTTTTRTLEAVARDQCRPGARGRGIRRVCSSTPASGSASLVRCSRIFTCPSRRCSCWSAPSVGVSWCSRRTGGP